MRVKMLRLMCSPVHGNHQPGDVVDLPDDEAARRIKAGYCVPVEEPKTRLRDRLRGRHKGARPEKPLEKRTVAELKAYCAEHGIDLDGASTKAQILAAVEAARDVDEDDGDG